MQETTDRRAVGPAIDEMAEDFVLSLVAQNKAPTTVKIYRTGVAQLGAFLAERGMPREIAHVRREHVEAFIAHLVETKSASTAKTRYGALAVFFGWAEEEGELPNGNPMARMKPPAVPEQPVPVLTDDDVNAVLATCAGRDFADRRDTAIIMLFRNTGMRLSELAGLRLDDVDFDASVAYVMGKGRRGRAAPFDSTTALALRRYLRERNRHPKAPTTDAFWVGKLGPLGADGVKQMIERRGLQAGVPVHAHMFRHTFAHEWLAQGGTEGSLMSIAGWRNRAMLDRYGRSARDERARDEYRRLRQPGGPR